MQIKVPVRND